MKKNKPRILRKAALIAVGVFLGRGAQADTTLTFDCTPVANHAALTDCIPPQTNNPNSPPGITNYGNFAAASSPGIAVSGFGTPNIGLTWGSDNFPDTRWEYYNTSGGLWGDGGSGVVQLQDSAVGTTEELTFTPNNPSVRVVVKSFDFFAYYNSNERFTYNVRVVSGTNVLSSQTISYLSDGTKNHPVNINYTGALGQTLKLQLRRVASTLGAGEVEGNEYNNAVDDITFAQTPASTFAGGPQVASVTPADDTTGLPATNTPPYAAIITNSATLSVAVPIGLKLDYAPVSPPPTITPLGGGQTSVTYPGGATLLSSGLHVYTLTYADNLGGVYTNEVVFSTIYTTLPAAYALPAGSGIVRGFTFRTVSADLQVSSSLDSSIARAEAQLNGTLINTNTSMPYTNDATLGTNADGSFNIDTVLNFTGDGIDEGDFTGDQPFPGLPFSPNRWFSSEGLLYLNLPAGYYRLGVNSDDGFQVTATPPQGISGAPIVLGVFNNGRGAADTLFDVLVPTSGVYPFRLVYFQSSGSSECEFFSVTNFTTGDKVLINDSAGNAVKSFRVLAPRITSIAKSGTNVVVNWAYGTPPYQVQFKTNVNDAVWNNFGAPIASTTTNVPIQSSTKFIRVFYVQP
jgi:hypothetical protein